MSVTRFRFRLELPNKDLYSFFVEVIGEYTNITVPEQAWLKAFSEANRFIPWYFVSDEATKHLLPKSRWVSIERHPEYTTQRLFTKETHLLGALKYSECTTHDIIILRFVGIE